MINLNITNLFDSIFLNDFLNRADKLKLTSKINTIGKYNKCNWCQMLTDPMLIAN